MNVLLDECVDRRLGKYLIGHRVATVPRIGWAGTKNGALLALAEKKFDVLITVDRQISSQQNLAKFQIAILLLLARSNRMKDLAPLVPRILRALEETTTSELTVIGL